MSNFDLPALKAYQLAREAAAAFDLSDRAKLRFTGKDRASFLNNFCTNDVVRCPVGHGCEAFLLTNQAKIVAWLQIHIGAEALFVTAEPGLAAKIIPYLSRFIVTEEVEIEDATEVEGLIHVTGPAAMDRLGRLLQLDLSAWSDWQWRSHAFQGFPCTVQRRDWLGQPGFHLGFPREHAATVVEALARQDIPMGWPETYESLRIEARVPVYGKDLDETHLPQEVQRTEQAISFTKGCYLGQETVARIRAYGHVNRMLVQLAAQEPHTMMEPLAAGTQLWAGEQAVGQITSCCYSPREQTLLALAYVRRGFHEPGQVLEARSLGQAITFNRVG